MKNKTLSAAVETLIQSLIKDEDYRRSWKANIAMAFKDEFHREVTRKKSWQINSTELHNVANTAADNFLNNLCKM